MITEFAMQQQRSYYKHAVNEIITLIQDNPANPVEVVEAFAKKMDRYACKGGPTSYIFSISYDAAIDILDGFIQRAGKKSGKKIPLVMTFYDMVTSTYFESTYEKVLIGQQEIIKDLVLNGTVSLKTYVEKLGIKTNIKNNKKWYFDHFEDSPLLLVFDNSITDIGDMSVCIISTNIKPK